jgi:hypothetical protein
MEETRSMDAEPSLSPRHVVRTRRRGTWRLASWSWLVTAAWTCHVAAQDHRGGAGEEVDSARRPNLAERATDPTQSPLTLRFKADVAPSLYARADGDRPEIRAGVELQPVVPLTLWRTDHILRLSLPYQAAGDGPSGFEDVQIFDLVVIETAAGRFGVGPAGNFSAREKEVRSHAAGGPAIGFVGPVTSSLNVGFLSQSFFARGVALSSVQPIVALQFGRGWALSTGDMELVFDWREMAFLRAPVQVEVGKLFDVAKPSVRVATGFEYNFKPRPGADRVTLKLVLELLLPERR